MNLVRWRDISEKGSIKSGRMLMNEVNEKLDSLSKKAYMLLDETGSDHVAYALKLYDYMGELDSVLFIMLPMDEELFQKCTSNTKYVIFCAVHANR